MSKDDNIPDAPPCRALVALEPAPERTGVVPPRPRAAFLTQIIACERRFDAYRARRRADPVEASARYGAAATPAPVAGRTRSVL